MWYVYFVEQSWSELLKQAYNALNGLDETNVTWITEDYILSTKSFNKSSSFIFGRFEGKAFNYLKSLNMTIFGPQCLLDYLRIDEVLPKVHVPLFSTALKGVHICFTAFNEETRKALSDKVEMLHGIVNKDLKVCVKVLVSSTVGTEKYRVAAEKGIIIVLQGWIEEIWKLSESNDSLDGLDEKLIKKYRIPVFYNLQICLSGFSLSEREEAKEIISKNGGEYCVDLTVGSCTHLIAKEAFGQKFHYASKWKIETVSWDWLVESVGKGYSCDENKYRLCGKDHVTGSTPKSESRNSSFDPKCSKEVSTITVDGKIDETYLYSTDDEMNSISENSIWRDCVIDFLKCNEEFINKWNRLINENGGRTCRNGNNRNALLIVTHVIVGEVNCEIQQKEEERINYVNQDWLETCWNEKKLVNVEKFIVEITKKSAITFSSDFNFQSENWESLSQFNLEDTVKQGDNPNNNKEQNAMNMSIEQPETGKVTLRGNPSNNKEQNAMNMSIEQPETRKVTLGGNPNNNKEQNAMNMSIEQPETGKVTLRGNPSNNMEQNAMNMSIGETETTTEDQNETMITGIFDNCLFFLDNLSSSKSKQITKLIIENSGTIITNPTNTEKYHVLSDSLSRSIKSVVVGDVGHQTTRFVTTFYIEECSKHNQLLPLESDFMFTPLRAIDSNISGNIFQGTVLSFSGYPGEERKLLKAISNEFGAIVQDQMSRKPIPGKKILATTHLIISKPDNKKLPSSKSWRIPAVTKHWIGECISKGKLVETDSYVLECSDYDDNMSIMTTTSDKSNFDDTFLTVNAPQPRHHAKPLNNNLLIAPIVEESQVFTEDFKSPAVNKNLQIRNTKQLNDSFSDMESPILRTCSNEPRPKLIIDQDMFKTPEFYERKYPAKVVSISTPDVTRALKSRMALLDIETKKKPNKFLDVSLSELDKPKLMLPLNSVSIYICKSMQAEQIILREIIEKLGGKFCWSYEPKIITHVICCLTKENCPLSSRIRDELERPVRDGKILVTSEWLIACDNEQKRVDEVKYLVNTAELLESGLSDFCGKKRKASEDLSDLTNQVYDIPAAKKRLSQDCEVISSQIEWKYNQKSPSKHDSFSSTESTQLDEIMGSEKIIMLCSMDKTLYEGYSEAINKLGGTLELSSDFNMKVTHLICGEPGRTEKYLSAVAAGKWVLHRSYIDESIVAGRWLDENEFQWGGPRTQEFFESNSGKTYSKQEMALADAAKRLHEIGGGVFKEWRVCLIEKQEKYEKMAKIIEAGGGTVLPLSEPVTQLRATHFLINKNQCYDLPDLSLYPCYKIDIIPYFLSSRNEIENKKMIKKFTISSSEMKSFTRQNKGENARTRQSRKI